LIPRYPFSQLVGLRGAGIAARSYPARDVSTGGFFLATDDAFELFSDVELEVELASGERVSLRARIVHVLTPDKARGVGVIAGIGVQFEGLGEPQLAQVRALVAWARANDSRARIARKKPEADPNALHNEPMLSYLFDHIDGQRDPEALAEELGIEAGSVERMQRELVKLGVIELISANGQAPTSQRPPAPTPSAANARSDAKPASLPPKQLEELTGLEQRISRGNFYLALDVSEAASTDSIRARFQALSAALLGWHAKPADMARIERVQNQLREAFGVLSSPQKRAEYDQYLARGRELAQAEAERAKRAANDQSKPMRAPSPPAAAAVHARNAQRPRPTGARAAAEQASPLGAAAQILLQAEQAHAAGKLAEAGKHLQLLTAMTFDDAKIRARVAQLKTQVARALAVDFEKQAAYEEKQQRWALAARSWLRVAEGRPKDSLPLQRAALAQMQVPGVDLKQVLELAKRAVELSDGDPEAHRTLARVYVAAGMQANARRELEAAQRCDPPLEEDAGKDAAGKAKPERGLFKRLLGREAPN
jgi:Tfp pilus assembly protein PilZ